MSIYRQRDKILRRMGYANYAAYLQSSQWRTIRARVLSAYGNACQCCNRRAWHVHHTDYSEPILAGREDQALMALCGRCHRKAEIVKGRKATLSAANKALIHKRQRKMERLGMFTKPPKPKGRPRMWEKQARMSKAEAAYKAAAFR